MGLKVGLYGRDQLTAIPWPDNAAGLYARHYLHPLLENGIRPYLANVQTDLRVLIVGEVVLPLTVNRYHPANSYVCSPYNQYFAYSRQELHKLDQPLLETLLKTILTPFTWYYRPDTFDRVVYLNNWLLSTNLYPALGPSHLARLTSFLLDHFPDRPLIFRSVDGLGNPGLYQALLTLGYRPVFNRHIYYQDARDPALLQKKQQKIDHKLYRESEYRLLTGQELPPAVFPRLVTLYRQLYLEKYSFFNPQFTEKFVALTLKQRLLTFRAFEREGQIDAVLGYFERNGIMTTPFFGYDTSLPQELGLYRLLSRQVVLEGLAQGWLINISAGVGRFKRIRGGQPVLEYNLIYDRHLPAAQRRRWSLLKLITDRIAAPLIQRYEL
jgi:hypothetical protein